MIRRLLGLSLGTLVLLAGCGPQPRARIPSSGVTAVDGGGQAELHNQPRGESNFPYQQ